MKTNIIQFPIHDNGIDKTPENASTAVLDTYTESEKRSFDITDVARMFREDVKAAKKAGELPKALKLSVRIERFAGGTAINVVIKACGFNPMNKVRVVLDNTDSNLFLSLSNPPTIHTEEAHALKDKLESMLKRYNYDNSDSQSDYFDVNFYQHIDFGSELERESRKEILRDSGIEW